MNKEFLKMQKLAGLITENQFRQLSEVEEIDSTISDNPDFKKLVDLLRNNPKDAQELAKKKDDIIDAVEDESINEAYRRNGKYYVQNTYGEEREVSFKEYLKNKGVSITLSAAAMALLGSAMAGALGTNTPNEILDAVLVASGIGAAAGAAFGENKSEFKEIIGDIDDTPSPDGDFNPMDYAEEEMNTLDHDVYMDMLNAAFEALGSKADAHSENTWGQKEKDLANRFGEIIRAANIDLL
jgi:hypothetical protein